MLHLNIPIIAYTQGKAIDALVVLDTGKPRLSYIKLSHRRKLWN